MKQILIVFVILLGIISCEDDNPVIPEKIQNKDFYINSLLADFGIPGNNVIIFGKGFGSDVDKIQVYFDTLRAEIKSLNDTSAIVVIPNLDSGYVDVKIVKDTLIAKSPKQFNVLYLMIDRLSKDNQKAGGYIYIYLKNYHSNNNTYVYFNDISTTILMKTNEGLKVNVPSTEGFYKLTVKSFNQTATFNDFIVLDPNKTYFFFIKEFTPVKGKIGDTVKISYENFGIDKSNIDVKFNDVVADKIGIDDSTIIVKVPHQLARGFVSISLNYNNQKVTNGNKFEVINSSYRFSSVSLEFKNFLIEKTHNSTYSHYPDPPYNEHTVETLVDNYHFDFDFTEEGVKDNSVGSNIYYQINKPGRDKTFKCSINSKQNILENISFIININPPPQQGYTSYNYIATLNELIYSFENNDIISYINSDMINQTIYTVYKKSGSSYMYGHTFSSSTTDYRVLGTTDSSNISLILVPVK